MRDRFMLQLNKFTYAKLLEITNEPANLAYETIVKYINENSRNDITVIRDDTNYTNWFKERTKSDEIRNKKRDPLSKIISLSSEMAIKLDKLRGNKGMNKFLNILILKILFQMELPEKIQYGKYYRLFLQKEVYLKLDELGLTRFAARRLLIRFLKTKYGFECVDFERKNSIKSIVHNSFALRPEMKEFIDGIRGNKSISTYCNHVILSVLNKREKRKREMSQIIVKEI